MGTLWWLIEDGGAGPRVLLLGKWGAELMRGGLGTRDDEVAAEDLEGVEPAGHASDVKSWLEAVGGRARLGSDARSDPPWIDDRTGESHPDAWVWYLRAYWRSNDEGLPWPPDVVSDPHCFLRLLLTSPDQETAIPVVQQLRIDLVRELACWLHRVPIHELAASIMGVQAMAPEEARERVLLMKRAVAAVLPHAELMRAMKSIGRDQPGR